MNIVLRIFIALLGSSFTIYIIHLLVNKKMTEKYSILWLIGTLGVLFVSIFPKVLDTTARFLGIDYPPALLFLSSIIIILLLNVYHSVQITILNSRLKELVEVIVVNKFVFDKDINNSVEKISQEENL